MDSRTPTQHERTTLVRFEAVYEAWRLATEAWLAAEVLLWTEALQRPGSPECTRLGNEAARLRDGARSAYLRVLDVLVQSPSD